MNNRVKINDAVNKKTFHLLYEMAHAKEGSTQVSHSTVIALSFAARLLNNVPLGWADVSHDSPKAIYLT
jgi:hypothetical protein